MSIDHVAYTPAERHPFLRVPPKLPRMSVRTFDAAAAQFLADMQAHTTFRYFALCRQRLTMFRLYIEELGSFGGKVLQAINQTTIRGYLWHAAGTLKYAPASCHMALDVLRHFFRWCVQNGYLVESPLKGIQAPPKRNFPIKGIYTRAEFHELLYACSGKYASEWRGVITTGFHTGLRLSDCVQMKWEWIDWQAEAIVMQPQKTVSSNITVQIPIEPTELYPILKIRNEHRSDHFLASTYVFPMLAAYLQFDNGHSKGISTLFTHIRTRAKVRKLGFHCLRHSFCSRMINAGVDSIVTAAMTGHRNLRTLRGYSRVSLSATREAMRKAMHDGNATP